MKAPLTREARKQRGAIAILAAIVLIALGGMIALSLNIGHKVSARTELQASFDSGSLAGALSFDGTTAGITNAKSVGMYAAVQHAVDKYTVALNSSDVVPGYWNATTKAFFPFGQSVTIGDSAIFLDQAATPQYFNALKVGGGADGQSGHNSSLGVILGGFFGPNGNMRVATSAVSVGGGPCSVTGCTLPLAVPAWSLLDAGGATACGTKITMGFNFGQGKLVAFADIRQPSNNPPNFKDIQDQNALVQHCAATPDASDLPVTVGDVIQLTNGVLPQQAYDSFDPLICPVAAAPYAGCARYQIPVINIPQTPMNQTQAVVGFVRVVLLGQNRVDGNTASIDIYIDCAGTSTGPTGCASFGYNTKKVRLVQ
ncbi:MAG TPA: pilus assembly protein TadG-related protein [Polyangia bacterium]|nr:pilus assembly protein TadG-related protein [Polyangia bacterium]